MPACGLEAFQQAAQHSDPTDHNWLGLYFEGKDRFIPPPPHFRLSRCSTRVPPRPLAARWLTGGVTGSAPRPGCLLSHGRARLRARRDTPLAPAALVVWGPCVPGRAQAGGGSGEARPPQPALPWRRDGRPGGEGPAAAAFPAPSAARGGRAELGRAAPRSSAPRAAPASGPGGNPPPPRTGKCGRGPSPALGRRRQWSRHGSCRRAAAPLPSPGPWPLLRWPFRLLPRPFIQGRAGLPSYTPGPWGAGLSHRELRAALAPHVPHSPAGAAGCPGPHASPFPPGAAGSPGSPCTPLTPGVVSPPGPPPAPLTLGSAGPPNHSPHPGG